MKRKSYRAIAEELNRMGMLTLMGKAWTGGNVAILLRRA